MAVLGACFGNKKCQRVRDCKDRCSAGLAYNTDLVKGCKDQCDASDGYTPANAADYAKNHLLGGETLFIANYGFDVDPNSGPSMDDAAPGAINMNLVMIGGAAIALILIIVLFMKA
jgi:hypothetical protein